MLEGLFEVDEEFLGGGRCTSLRRECLGLNSEMDWIIYSTNGLMSIGWVWNIWDICITGGIEIKTVYYY